MRFCRALLCVVALLAVPGVVAAQPQPSPDEFVPVTEVPPEEQIPAINLIGAAYGFVWIVVVGYVWSLGRRMQKAEADLAALERKAR
ncbi:MAG TPA: CcmD family protein [Vicinamibacterales bacterium]|jgi:CcmD family protein|nr:CcmD family protein [Vicinamibacterales bacterium]